MALSQAKAHEQLGVDIPFPTNLIALGERFAEESAWSYMLARLPDMRRLSVLIPGCYMAGEDIQFWTRQGVQRVEGIDVYALNDHWAKLIPKLRAQWSTPVFFRQGSIENIPFADDEFDVIASAAVLEHVRNLPAMAAETARVLKPGGFALHSFGPLYYCFGADHCIGAYGLEAGYDHILLAEEDYRRKISDRPFFERATKNPDLGFWAVNGQFSFAVGSEYIEVFRKHFDIEYVVAMISTPGLEYRKRFPDKWAKLLNAGVGEADLLLKGLSVVLRKPARTKGMA
ncbi:MAG: hypothetical protein C3F11_00085 [Methylocystaceae bacterium]|nr:MAG: hypothetical protein C3F11_00085 [Methylocystaceae bacterium]